MEVIEFVLYKVLNPSARRCSCLWGLRQGKGTSNVQLECEPHRLRPQVSHPLLSSRLSLSVTVSSDVPVTTAGSHACDSSGEKPNKFK